MTDEKAAGAVDRRLGERVRMRRLEIGMSQECLAGLVGITFQQVQKYEKGVNRIAASRLVSISNALDLPIAKFFEHLTEKTDTPREPNGALDRALANPQAMELVLMFDAVTNTQVRRRIVELVRAMAEDHA